VVFGAGSHLSQIQESAFAGCLSVSSIGIPRSVEGIPYDCFSSCEKRSTVIFECGSRLSDFEESACLECPSPSSIYISESIEALIRESGQYDGFLITTVPERVAEAQDGESASERTDDSNPPPE
jgi:hypothetical protein